MWFRCIECGKVIARIVIDPKYAEWLKHVYTDAYWSGSTRRDHMG